MKGRLYFATKAQKEGKVMITTHPCAQIFCCDFEKVSCVIIHHTHTHHGVELHNRAFTTGGHCNAKVKHVAASLFKWRF